MTFDRPPREVYIRVARPRNGGGHVELGLEYRAGDDDVQLRNDLREMLRVEDDTDPKATAMEMGERASHRIERAHPDRAYFVESWYGVNDNEWIQIFQPFDVPRNR